jgi:hypothetical protein
MTPDGQPPNGATGDDTSSEGIKALQELETEALAQESNKPEDLVEKYAITEEESKTWAGRVDDARQWQGRIDKAKGELGGLQEETKKAKEAKEGDPPGKEPKDKPPKDKDKEEKPEGEGNDQFVTKDELWERDNAEQIELYGDDEYKADIEAGVPKEQALKYAKMRFDADPDHPNRKRAEEMGGGTRKVNREGQGAVTLTSHDERFGLTPEKKAELEKKHPHLTGAAPQPDLPT